MRLSMSKGIWRIASVSVLAVAMLLAVVACEDESDSATPTRAAAATPTAESMAPEATPPTESMAPEGTPTTGSMPAEPTATTEAMAATPTTETMAPPATPIPVVATTNIMADWVREVGGDRVDVFSLVPVGADPHGYQPGAQAVAKIADADLVLSVGLGLEESWLHELLENAARDEESIVEMAELIDPIEFSQRLT